MTLLFHHIPKTGGTFVIRSLEGSGLSHQRIFFWKSVPDPGDFELFSSHHALHPGKCRRNFENPFWFTWLRNPVDVFYSAFHYYREKFPEELIAKTPPLLRTQITKIKAAESLAQYAETVRSPYPCGWYPVNLDVFDFIGTAETIEKSLERLSERIGIRLKVATAEINRGSYDRSERPSEDRIRPLLRAESLAWLAVLAARDADPKHAE